MNKKKGKKERLFNHSINLCCIARKLCGNIRRQ